jgi:hypothetical protein
MANKKKKNGNGGRKNGNRNNAGTKALATRGLASALMQLNENRRPNTVNASHLRGSDFITTVNTAPNTGATGTILATFPISPSAYPGTRITSLSQLWERFRFKSLSLRYVPAVPMTIACQLIIYVDTDPLDDPSTIADPNAILRQATAQARSQQFNFNKAKNISLCIRKDDQFYYTGADKQNLRFSNQGTAYIIQVTDVLDFNGAVLSEPVSAGSIYLDWNLCFDIPQINPSALQVSTWNGVPPVSYRRADIFLNGSDLLPSNISLRPNQAYSVTFDYSSFVVNAPTEVDLAIAMTTTSPNPVSPIIADRWGTAHSTFARAIIFTGPDGNVDLEFDSSNTIDVSTTTGTAQLLFAPISF